MSKDFFLFQLFTPSLLLLLLVVELARVVEGYVIPILFGIAEISLLAYKKKHIEPQALTRGQQVLEFLFLRICQKIEYSVFFFSWVLSKL